MRILGIVAGAITALMGANAMAQDASSVATTNFMQLCIAEGQGQVADPKAPCACGAGVLGGKMTQSRFELMGKLILFANNPNAMNQQVQTLLNQGVPAAEIQATAIDMQSAAQIIPRVCSAVERPGVLPVSMRKMAVAEGGFATNFTVAKSSIIYNALAAN